MKRRIMLAVLTSAALASSLQAQEKAKPIPTSDDRPIQEFLSAETDKLSQRFLDGAKSLEDWKEKLPRLKREYLDMLGLWPLPEKTPLQATVTGQLEAHGVVVEKIHFQSKPGLYVTANLYRPKIRVARPESSKGVPASDSTPFEDSGRATQNAVKRLPAVLYVCGHSNRGRDGNKSAYQSHGFWFANNGYVCLLLDTLQLGEIPGVHHGTYGRPWNHLKPYGIPSLSPPHPVTPSPLFPVGGDTHETRFWWWSAGYTPAGVECWNGIRAIDYLLTRPEVDPERIGVTGISGGGAATFWIAAADERVKVAVPVSGMSDLESYVKNKVINGHCDCMFLYNTHQWDWTTIAALVAPRPLLFANSDDDKIFPMDGNRRIIEKLHTIYFKYGKAELVEEYVSKGGHAYRPDLRVAIFKFINKHLKGDAAAAVEDSAKYTEVPGKDLRVFPTDAEIPKDAINARIDETFVPRGKPALPVESRFASWRRARLNELLGRCFQSLLDGKRENTLPFTDQTLLVGKGKGPAPMVVMERKDFIGIRNFDVFARQYQDRDSAAFLYFADELLSWNKKSPPNYVERSQLLLGHTMDEHRVYQLMKSAQSLAGYEASQTWNHRIVGKGADGILAVYAALFEPSIKEVVVIDPPKSHKDGPHFLGVLRVLDIPEALGLLAPMPLTIIGGKDAAFDRTAEIYRRAGASEKLKRK